VGLQNKTSPLNRAFDVFLLEQKASGNTKATREFYRWMLHPFLDYLAGVDVARLEEVTPHHIRTYLVSMRERGLSGYTVHGAAGSIRAWFQFLRSGRAIGGLAHG
jgi:site-specific recombinase XerD